MKELNKDFYCLKELSPIVNLKYRQLSKKMILIRKKYQNMTDLLYKKSNRWYIHNSLINEFTRERTPIKYKLFITIASKNKFDYDYWKYYINQLYKKLKIIDPSTRIKYVIEPTKKSINHLHFMTTFDKQEKLENIIEEDDLSNKSNDMNTAIENIYYLKKLHKYFRKQNKPVLLKY